MAASTGRRLLGLIAIIALAVGLGRPARADDDEDHDPAALRRRTVEALRDVGEAQTDEELDRALDRFDQRVGEEQRGARDHLLDRLEPQDGEEPPTR